MRARWAVLLLILAGCRSITSEDVWQRRLGVVDPAMSSVQMIQFPPVVDAGVPFTVVIHTLGSSSCTRPSGVDVDVDGLEATLRPYDLYAPGDRACTDDLHAFRHETAVTFSAAGSARLVVRARDHQGRSRADTFSISVRPGSGAAWTRSPGIIEAGSTSMPIVAVPTEAILGEPLAIVVRTFDSSSCTVAAGADVSLSQSTADVTPYDWHAPPGTACTSDLHAFEHPVTLTFRSVGEAKLRVHGRRLGGGSVTYTYTIPVRRSPLT